MGIKKAAPHEYVIEDPVVYSRQCIRCGHEHPASQECDPEQKKEWQEYWKRKMELLSA